MEHSAEMRRCLIDCDVEQVRKLWRHVQPGLPQPASDYQALATIHRARTIMDSMPFKLRAYSHRWLEERGLPSGLPDHLKSSAEREYPRIADVVGVACLSKSGSLFAPIVKHMQGAMSDSVLESYADNERRPEVVKPRMMQAREKVVQKLLGIFKDRSFISMSR